ncbi:SPW repeat protein [Streptomyces sp. SCL15-4]|uniref:SPW repeat protein n=1 Tax=Streptomyces sp. SCL15-4 TaxID=2967221 RepID=UPI002966F657|nr:SPW repeat protein [Streptomyces sp. SCL15-4]
MSYPQYSTGMTGHPEMAEMRDRLERTASTGKAIALEGLILLTGVYTAISPWVVHFSGQPNLTANNLIVGITTALIGLGLALVPERMFRLAWALVPLGIWLIISPWIVTPAHGARAGVIWNNILTGVITMALGLAAMGLTIAVTRPERH